MGSKGRDLDKLAQQRNGRMEFGQLRQIANLVKPQLSDVGMLFGCAKPFRK